MRIKDWRDVVKLVKLLALMVVEFWMSGKANKLS